MATRKPEDRPVSRQAFERRFPDERACADHLISARWPDGFRCAKCSSEKGWRLEHRLATFECATCYVQTSATAGTIMHGTHLPLRTWFLAAHMVATHSNGVSAYQIKDQLGIGSYKSAWFLLHRLRKAMVSPDREALAGIIEIDETSIPFRTKDEPVAGGQGRSPIGKLVVAGAVEVYADGTPGRIRLSAIPDFTRKTLHGFVERATKPGSALATDGNPSYNGAPERLHYPTVVKDMPAPVFLPWIHRVFSNLKRWGLGVYHGFRRPYLQAYLDEFAFRWNRRKRRAVSVDKLLGIGMRTPHTSYQGLVTGR